MVDVVDRKTRSRMMSGIRGKDTKPEQIVRRALHARGFRFRLHDRRLPGAPDLVFPKYGSVILIHGCFWHAHQCKIFKWPRTNRLFWRTKIEGNASRDAVVKAMLRKEGWRVFTIWECTLRTRNPNKLERIIDRAESWLRAAK